MRWIKECLILILLGAMLVPTQALAAEVSPEKQAQLAQHGWTVRDEDAPAVTEAGLQDSCLGNFEARRIASGIWYGNERQTGMKLLVAACANNGRVTKFWCRAHSWAPGAHWRKVWGANIVRWKGDHGAGCRATTLFGFDGVTYQNWTGVLALGAHVKGERAIWWSKKRRWF